MQGFAADAALTAFPSRPDRTAEDIPLSSKMEAVLRHSVIPRLAARHVPERAGSPPAPPDRQARHLTTLALAGDMEAACTLLHQHGTASCALIRRSAARLGAMWLRDDCSGFDLTLGLCLLQTVARRIDPDLPYAPRAPPQAALVIPQPDEPHTLGAALAAHALRRAGWEVHAAFPGTDAAVGRLVAGTWFDRIDLAFSTALRRDDRLPDMARTIGLVRRASRNPALHVAVHGRSFDENSAAVAEVCG